jgi:hypothetical protein
MGVGDGKWEAIRPYAAKMPDGAHKYTDRLDRRPSRDKIHG